MTENIVDINALIVSSAAEQAVDFADVLEKVFQSFSAEVATTLHEALDFQSLGKFNACFIADTFSEKEIQSFMQDMRKIGRDKSCVFIQMRNTVPDSFDRKSLHHLGYATVVTPAANTKDKQEMQIALKDALHAGDLRRRAKDIGTATKLVLREIDLTAADRKRGVDRHLPTKSNSFFKSQANFDGVLMDKYYEALEEGTAQATPAKNCSLEVPETVLQKQLPRLEKDRYKGTSRRVWRMLMGKHGKKEEEEKNSDTPPTPAPEKQGESES